MLSTQRNTCIMNDDGLHYIRSQVHIILHVLPFFFIITYAPILVDVVSWRKRFLNSCENKLCF